MYTRQFGSIEYILREFALYEDNTIFLLWFSRYDSKWGWFFGFSTHCWSSILVWEILEFPHSVCVKVAFAITNSYVNPVTYYPIFYLGIGSTCYKKKPPPGTHKVLPSKVTIIWIHIMCFHFGHCGNSEGWIRSTKMAEILVLDSVVVKVRIAIKCPKFTF